MRQKTLLALLIILLAESALGADQAVKEGEFWQGTCSCTCKRIVLNSASSYKADPGEDGAAKVITLCHEQCARLCGGYTNLSSDDNVECAGLCRIYCSTDYSDAIRPMQDKCELSCSSTCSYRGLVDGIVQVVYYAVGIIGALMLIVNGLRLVTSQDQCDRTAAKNGIIFVIIALIIIILAATLVGLFMNSSMTPQT